MIPISLEEQINCVRREIGMRERVYPRWVEQKKLLPAKADFELAAMRAVLRTIETVLLPDVTVRAGDDWRPMLTAPLDGTEVELMVRHLTYWTALKVDGLVKAESEWQGIVAGKWIDHNGGGWCWRGLTGEPLGWRPIVQPKVAAPAELGAAR